MITRLWGVVSLKLELPDGIETCRRTRPLRDDSLLCTDAELIRPEVRGCRSNLAFNLAVGQWNYAEYSSLDTILAMP